MGYNRPVCRFPAQPGTQLRFQNACHHAALVSLAESATLGYHQIRTDAEGHILPWYSAELSKAYDHNLRLVWSFWKGMEDCPNGVHR